ncbi:MAG: DUF5652 family protein [Patescibacteria group bacterium]
MGAIFADEKAFFIILAILFLWILPWKGYALWLSARNGHTKWFVALLILNTLAILDIIYIFAVGRKVAQSAKVNLSQ